MVRSLYSSISGLRNHQVKLDVIANNVANVNTVGFKSGRVTFEESMSQLLQGSSRPPGDQGGTNPVQVGLGMSVGSIDTMMVQGNLESTGKITDLAIEGDSMFVVSNGIGNFYSRNGAFQFDADGKMVLPTNGFILQGKMAADDGTFPVGTPIGDIKIPFSVQSPAKETSEIELARNLDSDSEARGTVLYTQPFYSKLENFQMAPGGAPTEWPSVGNGAESPSLTNLYNQDGNALGIKLGDTLTISAELGDPNIATTSREAKILMVDAGDTRVSSYAAAVPAPGAPSNYYASNLGEFTACMRHFLSNNDAVSGFGADASQDVTVGFGKQGAAWENYSMMYVGNSVGNTSVIQNLSISSDRPISTAYVQSYFDFPATIDDNVNTIGVSNVYQGSQMLWKPAEITDALFVDRDGADVGLTDTDPNIYTASGYPIDLSELDSLTLSGQVGERNRSSSNTITPYSDVTNSASDADAQDVETMGDLCTWIRNSLGLPELIPDNQGIPTSSVTMNGYNPDDNMPDGSLAIRGQLETAFSINNLNITASSQVVGNSPTNFNANMTFTELQTARDTGVVDTSIEVYDDSGAAHTLTVTFTHSGEKNPPTWLWEVSTAGGEDIVHGRTGRLTFSLDGTPSSFTFDESGISEIEINPLNGAKNLHVDIDWGSPGSFQGLTQMAADSTASATGQDGYASGNLQNISIDEFAQVTGSFSNGISKPLAQIMTAEFKNPAGLLKRGDSVYAQSNNSGEAIMGIPGYSNSSKVRPGALELSNVDLATEFTSMITTQRGYSANAKVITTSDEMLQELLNIVR